jgi:ABC-type phosphate/phosphonate transport system substrate-binding protein
MAWVTPFVASRVRLLVSRLLTIVRYGATGCAATFVVHRDSDIASLEDLRGKRASWVDPLSMNGHLMALKHLQKRGFDPRTHFSEQHFSGSYRATLSEVAEGRSDVTSFFVVANDRDMTLREMRDLLGARAESLAILEITDPAPFDAIAIPGGPRSSFVADELLKLDQKMSPPAMLLEVCRADRFVEADLDAYAGFDEYVDLTSL